MADNIDVNPGNESDKVSVATDDIDGVHYPIYKFAIGADGEATLVDSDNRIPVKLEYEPLADVLSCLQRIEKELLKMNLYNALAHDEEITNEDI